MKTWFVRTIWINEMKGAPNGLMEMKNFPSPWPDRSLIWRIQIGKPTKRVVKYEI